VAWDKLGDAAVAQLAAEIAVRRYLAG